MTEIFRHYDSARVGYYQSVLESAGIRTLFRNEHGNTINHGAPIPAFYPALCVMNEGDVERAKTLIARLESDDSQSSDRSPQEDWTCEHCGETVPGGFEICWQCEQ